MLWSALLISVATAQTVQWAHSLGLPNRSRAVAIANDSLGNSYTLGTSRTSTQSIMGVLPTGNLLLEKRDSMGVVKWTKMFPGHGSGLDIAVAKSGDVLITGGFYDSLYFGGDTLKSPNFVDRMFLASFSSDGKLNWSFSDTSQWGQLGISITIKDASSFYLCGISGSIDGLLEQYDFSGNRIWNKQFQGIRNFDNLVLDKDNNIYISGTCTPQAVFDTVVMSPDSSAAGYVTFVAKLDPNGKTIWLRANPYSTFNISTSLAFDGFGYLSRIRQSSDFTKIIYEVIDPWIDSVLQTWAFPVSTGDFDHLLTNSITSCASSNLFFGPYFATSHIDTTFIYQLGHGISLQGIVFLMDTFIVVKGGGLRAEAISLYDRAVYLSGYFHDPTLTLGSIVLNNENNTAKFESSFFLTRIAPEGTAAVKYKYDAQALSLYPNPASDELHLEFDNDCSREITIYNMLGAIQYHSQTSSSRLTIDTHDLITGAYKLLVRDERGLRTASFIRR